MQTVADFLYTLYECLKARRRQTMRTAIKDLGKTQCKFSDTISPTSIHRLSSLSISKGKDPSQGSPADSC